MGRKKGTEKTGGRIAGTPNKVTSSVRDWIQQIIDGNRDKFEADLNALEPIDRVKVISNLLQYIVPKVQSVSPEEALEAELHKIRELLFEVPDEAVNKIAQKVAELTNRRIDNG